MPAPACKPAAITQHLPRGTRPFARRAVVGVRLGRRLAAGLTPQQAATAEGLGKSEVATLLAEPTFAGLVEADRAL